MQIYIIRDDDPYFGYYSAQSWKPNMGVERPSVAEVRVVEVQEQFWKMVVEEGGIPEDDDHGNDRVWFGLFNKGETIWVRPEPVRPGGE